MTYKIHLGDCREILHTINPRIIVTDAPKLILPWLISYAEDHNDCLLVNAYSRDWIIGDHGEKHWQHYLPIIQAVSDRGDTICDPCMGSGAIGIAAMMDGRNFVGIENRSKRFSVAKERLRDFENSAPHRTIA